MQYNFDELINRTGTHSSKLDRMPKGSPPDALSVWVADMDFACAPPILNALHARIDQKIFGYTVYNNAELKSAITGWFARRYNWQVTAEDVFFSPGVVPALAFLLQILTNPGDGVIIQRPVYYPFTNKIIASKRKIYNSALLYQDGNYTMNYADLEAKFVDDKVKGMILCSPHNPVGRVWTPDELRRLIDIAKKHNKWIISDEIHMDLTRKGVTHTPLLKLAPEYANHIVTCTAPSKTFNLAGMQLSNIIIPNKAWQQKWNDVISAQYALEDPSPFALAATVAAYTECDEWLEELRSYLDDNIRYVQDFLTTNLPKAKLISPEATYLLWIDLTAYEPDAEKLEKLMQNTAKIAFDEGYIFGEEGNGFERINIAMPRSRVQECVERMKMALDAHMAAN